MTTAITSTSPKYYAEHSGGFVHLRQARYKAQFDAGEEHPHDVCAIAHSVEELQKMVAGVFVGAIDWADPTQPKI